jgi:hypothetical protein
MILEATYENGQIVFLEQPPMRGKTNVLVTFPEEEKPARLTSRKAGSLKGLIRTPDDFNEPLDDLKDYMY